MLFLVLAVLSSVTVAASIKVSENAGRNRISVALINYCIAAVVMFILWLLHGAVSVSGITVVCGVYAGITWVVALVLMMYAIQRIGIAISSAVVRMAVLLPTILSIVIWFEIPSTLQICGIALAAISILLLSLKVVRHENKFHLPDVIMVLGVWVTSGAAQLASKLYAELCPAREKDGYLVILFIVAFGVAWIWLRITGRTVEKKDLGYGVAVGVPNALSGLFLVSALQVLPGILVYPATAAAGVLLTVILGIALWREKLGIKGALGIAAAIIALVLVNLK